MVKPVNGFGTSGLMSSADSQSAISCPSATDGAWIDHRFTRQARALGHADQRMRNIKTFIVAPDFATNFGGDLVVDRVGQVLRDAISVSIRGVVVRVVQVGNRCQFVGDLPSRRDRRSDNEDRDRCSAFQVRYVWTRSTQQTFRH